MDLDGQRVVRAEERDLRDLDGGSENREGGEVGRALERVGRRKPPGHEALSA